MIHLWCLWEWFHVGVKLVSELHILFVIILFLVAVSCASNIKDGFSTHPLQYFNCCSRINKCIFSLKLLIKRNIYTFKSDNTTHPSDDMYVYMNIHRSNLAISSSLEITNESLTANGRVEREFMWPITFYVYASSQFCHGLLLEIIIVDGCDTFLVNDANYKWF